MVKRFDYLVIGSCIAGMSFALKVANKGSVALICKTSLQEANTYYAQGGVASVTNPIDDFEKHIQDTLIAGDGHCDRAAVEKVVFFHIMDSLHLMFERESHVHFACEKSL